MRFSFSAPIAIYLLFTFFWMTLLTYASQNKPQEITPNLNFMIAQDQDVQITFNLLYAINKSIRYLILNQLLTIRDILILRKTCTDFQMLISPNDTKMVMFGETFCSKKITEVPLIWFHLKYFLNQTYTNAFDKMEVFNENQFNRKGNQYVVFTRTLDKKIICWYNDKTQYLKVILDKTRNELINNEKNNKRNLLTIDEYNPQKIWNQDETAWAKIINEENIVTGGNKTKEGDSNHHVPTQFRNVKIIVSTGNAFSALLSDDCHCLGR